MIKFAEIGLGQGFPHVVHLPCTDTDSYTCVRTHTHTSRDMSYCTFVPCVTDKAKDLPCKNILVFPSSDKGYQSHTGCACVCVIKQKHDLVTNRETFVLWYGMHAHLPWVTHTWVGHWVDSSGCDTKSGYRGEFPINHNASGLTHAHTCTDMHT